MLSEGRDGERGNRDQNILYLKIPIFNFFKKVLETKRQVEFCRKAYHNFAPVHRK